MKIAAILLGAIMAQAPVPVDPHAAAIDVSKAAVSALLRDPESARFTGVFFNEKTGAVCGRVNGHNAYGGYGKSTKFIAYGDKAALFTGHEVLDAAKALGWSEDRLFGGCPPG